MGTAAGAKLGRILALTQELVNGIEIRNRDSDVGLVALRFDVAGLN